MCQPVDRPPNVAHPTMCAPLYSLSCRREREHSTCSWRDACRPACSEIIVELEKLIERLPRDAAPRRPAVDAKLPSSPPRAWNRIKGWGSMLALRRLKSRDCSMGKSRRPSLEGVDSGPLALVGGGEGTHVGGRPRSGSVDSLQAIDAPGSRAASQRGVRAVSQRGVRPFVPSCPQDIPASPILSKPSSVAAADSPQDGRSVVGLLRKLGGPGSEGRLCKAQPLRSGRYDDGIGEGGICRSIEEAGER